MMRPGLALAAALSAALAAAGWLAHAQANGRVAGLTFLEAPVAQAQLALGQEIYAANCAACHGANLEGQPGWRRRNDDGRMPAPPHDETGHSWHHSDHTLFKITRLGVSAVVPNYESDMPAFGEVLSDAEITAALAYIKRT